MTVPSPGRDRTSSVPPRASNRSAMFAVPALRGLASGSNPAPSSATENSTAPSVFSSRPTACEAPAYFTTFCSASRPQKYTAASISCR